MFAVRGLILKTFAQLCDGDWADRIKEEKFRHHNAQWLEMVNQLKERSRRGGPRNGPMGSSSIVGSRDTLFDDASSMDDSGGNSYDPQANLLDRSALFAGSDIGMFHTALDFYSPRSAFSDLVHEHVEWRLWRRFLLSHLRLQIAKAALICFSDDAGNVSSDSDELMDANLLDGLDPSTVRRPVRPKSRYNNRLVDFFFHCELVAIGAELILYWLHNIPVETMRRSALIKFVPRHFAVINSSNLRLVFCAGSS